MPATLQRPCVECGTLTVSTRCPHHARVREQARGSASSRGYDAQWRRFRLWFRHQLIRRNIAPVCGAILPGGPVTTDSQCRADGRSTWDDLHLDHEPPLRDEERHNVRAVCNPVRVQFLCRRCHAAKTQRQERGR